MSKERIDFNESQDCTVVALSQAFDISYEAAHQLCKVYGRKDQQGFHVRAQLLGHLKDKLGIVVHWAGKRLSKFLEEINKTDYIDISQESFIILVKGHMLCVKNGKRMDGGIDNNVKIERCFLVKR